MGDVVAVKSHAEEVGGGLARAVRHLVAARPTFAALKHEVNRCGHVVRFRRPSNRAGAGHRRSFLHQRHGSECLLPGKEVKRAVLVLFAPASPVGQRVKVAQNFLFTRYLCGHVHSPQSQ